MDPFNVPVDGFEPAAGGIVFLGQMLREHALAEFGFMPGDIVSFFPWLRAGSAADEVDEVHSNWIPFSRGGSIRPIERRSPSREVAMLS